MTSFGIQFEQSLGFTYDVILKAALECEQFGYDSLRISDHFLWSVDTPGRPCLECWTTLSALAAATSKLRLGPLVSCNSYRYPSLLAKMAATLDNVSGGRLEFAIGAGWKEDEYRAYGISFPSFMTRIAQLREALIIVKKMWTEAKPSFKGEHYQIKDAACEPKPVQKPHPPIWIGTIKAGELIANLAAELADGVNIAWNPSPKLVESKKKLIEEKKGRFGRSGVIRISVGLRVWLAMNEAELSRIISKEAVALGRSVESYRKAVEASNAAIGCPEEVAEKIFELRRAGASDFVLLPPISETIKGESRSLRLFAEKVLQIVREEEDMD